MQVFVPGLVVSCNTVLFSEEKNGGRVDLGERKRRKDWAEWKEKAVIGMYYMKEE